MTLAPMPHLDAVPETQQPAARLQLRDAPVPAAADLPTTAAKYYRQIEAQTWEERIRQPDLQAKALLGPPGWSISTGVLRTILPYTAYRWGGGKTPATQAVPDYLNFYGLRAGSAAKLLEQLPTQALRDTQNGAPCLGAILQAVAAHPQLRCGGYYIGPQRLDERISCDTLLVRIENADFNPQAAGRSWQENLWQHVRATYQISDEGRCADENHLLGTMKGGRVSLWRLWWD